MPKTEQELNEMLAKAFREGVVAVSHCINSGRKTEELNPYAKETA